LSLKGAASLLHVETDAEEKEVEQAVKKIREEVLAKIQNVKDAENEVRQGLDACHAAVETLRLARLGASPGVSGERLLADGVRASGLQQPLGLRDLRRILGAPCPRTASWRAGEALRVALCCGATAELRPQELEESGSLFHGQAKASALQWANRALKLPSRESDSSASAICVCIRERLEEEGELNCFDDERPAKRAKGPKGPKSIRVRHLLLRCAEPGKLLPDDPMARRPKGANKNNGAASGTVRSLVEAEAQLITMLRGLLDPARKEADPLKSTLVPFRKLCQQHSECESGPFIHYLLSIQKM